MTSTSTENSNNNKTININKQNKPTYNKQYIVIDKYIVDYSTMLGKGAMAKVYLGYYAPGQGDPQARFAIKQISVNSSFIVTDSLLQQINLLRKLNHPFILKYVDAKKSPKMLYLILQLCNGRTLQQFVQESKGGLSQQMIKKIFAQIILAFRYLKQQKIIHRDIKPKNILLHNGNIKISDFGVAKTINQHNQVKQVNTFSGTFPFMSPQILRQNSYTFQTDIWSLGVTIYFMVFGRLPWKGTKPTQILNEIQSNQQGVEIPTNGISSQLRQLIKKMLTYDESQRITVQQIIQHSYLKQQIQQMQKQFYEESYTQTKQITKTQFFMINQPTSFNTQDCQQRCKQVQKSFRTTWVKQQFARQAYNKLTNYKQHIIFFQNVLQTLRNYHKKKDILEQDLFYKCQFLLVKRCYIIAKDLHSILLFGTHTQGNINIPKQEFQQLVYDKKGKNNYNRSLRDQVSRLYQRFKNDWLETKQKFFDYRRQYGIKIIQRGQAYQQALQQSTGLILAFQDCFMELFLKLSKGIIDTYAHRLSQEISNSNIMLNFGVHITFVYDLMVILCFPHYAQQGNMNAFKNKKKYIPVQQFIYRIQVAYKKWTKQGWTVQGKKEKTNNKGNNIN